jgi:hypothetical protein
MIRKITPLGLFADDGIWYVSSEKIQDQENTGTCHVLPQTGPEKNLIPRYSYN